MPLANAMKCPARGCILDIGAVLVDDHRVRELTLSNREHQHKSKNVIMASAFQRLDVENPSSGRRPREELIIRNSDSAVGTRRKNHHENTVVRDAKAHKEIP
jgi:hypothetical protein